MRLVEKDLIVVEKVFEHLMNVNSSGDLWLYFKGFCDCLGVLRNVLREERGG